MFRLRAALLAVLTLTVLTAQAPSQLAKDFEARYLKVGGKFNGVGIRDEQAKGQPIVGLDFTSNAKFSDADLKEVLTGLPDLQALNLGLTKVTDAAMKDVPQFKQLTIFRITGETPVTAAGLKELAALKQLKELDLRIGCVDAATLKALAGNQKLEKLVLSGKNVTDEVVKEAAAAFPKLQQLSLAGTAVTDEGLKPLAELKQLTSLNVAFTRVSKDGVQNLQKSLPKAKINR
jgi:internalin A